MEIGIPQNCDAPFPSPQKKKKKKIQGEFFFHQGIDYADSSNAFTFFFESSVPVAHSLASHCRRFEIILEAENVMSHSSLVLSPPSTSGSLYCLWEVARVTYYCGIGYT